jgi:hypothetical protein
MLNIGWKGVHKKSVQCINFRIPELLKSGNFRNPNIFQGPEISPSVFYIIKTSELQNF